MPDAALAKRLKELSEKATDAPWFVSKPYTDSITDCEETYSIGPRDSDAHYEDTLFTVHGENFQSADNARLVVELVNNLPTILAALERPARGAGDEETRLRAALQIAIGGLNCAVQTFVGDTIGPRANFVKHALAEAKKAYDDEGTRKASPPEGAAR